MRVIKDRDVLGFYSGLIGGSIALVFDWIFNKLGLTDRVYSETACGVWVNNKRQTKTFTGHFLGVITTLILSMLGGVAKTHRVTSGGRDHVIKKGIVFGMAFGAVINGLTSAFAVNKLKPMKPMSHLFYAVTSAIYGLITTLCISKFGHDSLFDQAPTNDYLKPTNETTEEGKDNLPIVAK